MASDAQLVGPLCNQYDL